MVACKRILFVDDEPRVLKGLENLLRRQHRVWDMVFAATSDAAIKELESRPFDVIITDMRMPRMDGATLLKQVRERFPGVVRIVLSGQTDQQMARRAISVAHQFLAKPCDGEVLRRVIARALSLQELLDDSGLRERVGSVDSLPSVPQVYEALIAALDDPSISLGSLARIVEEDSGLTAKVLQLVNSAFFGLGRETTSVSDAIRYLGIDVLKSLVLLIHATTATTAQARQIAEIHDRSIVTAQIAKLVAKDTPASSDAVTAGILADVGNLVIGYGMGLGDAIAEGARAKQVPAHEVEREVIGYTHAEIGAYLLGLWRLPYPIVEAVAHHHEPSRIETQELDLVTIIHVANTIACALLAGESDLTRELDRSHLERLGVWSDVFRWIEEAQDSKERASEWLRNSQCSASMTRSESFRV
jgi:HD-like signal output (HDOD) protein/CheY-like chemotaxis protein